MVRLPSKSFRAPLTNEYDVSSFRAQGFARGIVYARIGDWDNVRHMAW